MLKSVLYYMLLFTTSIRFFDLVYLLSKDSTNLPIPVIVLTSLMVLYGIFICVLKFIQVIRLRQFLTFYTIQSAMILFNLVYVSSTSPFRISVAETLVVGTFLDLLVNCVFIYLMLRRMRSFYFVPIRSDGGVMARQR